MFYRPALPDDEDELEHAPVKLSLSQVVMTGRGGRFLADGLMPGSYQLIVRQRGSRAARQSVVAKTDAPATRFELSPSPAVRGVVVDGAGRPLVGINVVLSQNARQFRAAARRFGDPPVRLNTRTAADGTFEFVDLPDNLEFALRAFGNHAGRVRHANLNDVPLDGKRVELQLK